MDIGTKFDVNIEFDVGIEFDITIEFDSEKDFNIKKESDIEKELDIRIEFSIKKELVGFENKSDLETNPSQIWKKWMTPMGFPGSNQDLLVSEKSHALNCYLFFAKVVIKNTNLQTC